MQLYIYIQHPELKLTISPPPPPPPPPRHRITETRHYPFLFFLHKDPTGATNGTVEVKTGAKVLIGTVEWTVVAAGTGGSSMDVLRLPPPSPPPLVLFESAPRQETASAAVWAILGALNDTHTAQDTAPRLIPPPRPLVLAKPVGLLSNVSYPFLDSFPSTAWMNALTATEDSLAVRTLCTAHHRTPHTAHRTPHTAHRTPHTIVHCIPRCIRGI